SSTLLRQDGDGALLEAVTAACRTVWPEASPEAVLAAIDRGDHDATANAYWTLDPVDGTKGFLRGGQYAVSLAYIDGGQVTLGVLGCPNLSADFEQSFDTPDSAGQVYSAVLGRGAFRVPADRPASEPERVTAAGGDAGAIRVCESVESGHSRQDMTRDVVAALGGAGAPARLDSQCNYAVVARGQADAYLRLPTRKGYQEKIWDHAAGKLVAEEAGAVVSDISGAPLDFSRGATLSGNRGVVCATPAWHGRIIDAIAGLDLAAD
ncbi:MAG: 3'(2'),5'-bisphosphate nucleotidase, partial [Gammaproteobacteria bacterium]|nr:3'(2'),5'-bisphosphate nucleotidase [Gammaproteobacteria bacterium]